MENFKELHHKINGDELSLPEQNVQAFVLDTNSMKLSVLDQLLLPKSIKYVDVPNCEKGHSVIKNMLVRGAPCIAAVGCLSIIVELNQTKYLEQENYNLDHLINWIQEKSSYLIESRPTAVNLRKALKQLVEYAKLQYNTCKNCRELINNLTRFCIEALEVGIKLNKQLGDFGADELILRATSDTDKTTGLVILTHCNTGSLATVGYGTALGVIKSLHKKGCLGRVFCTETRPYNQGSRLTAWELVREKIPATLIADNMVAYLMATKKIDAVVVGADCVASNGDTANKVGTLQIAVVAKHYGVPFYVAAPSQSIDLSTQDLSYITIEQRPADELRHMGGVMLAPEEIDVWNPCFDATPAKLITGIITEFGVCTTSGVREHMSKTRENGGKSSLGLY